MRGGERWIYLTTVARRRLGAVQKLLEKEHEDSGASFGIDLEHSLFDPLPTAFGGHISRSGNAMAEPWKVCFSSLAAEPRTKTGELVASANSMRIFIARIAPWLQLNCLSHFRLAYPLSCIRKWSLDTKIVRQYVSSWSFQPTFPLRCFHRWRLCLLPTHHGSPESGFAAKGGQGLDVVRWPGEDRRGVTPVSCKTGES